MTDKDDIRRYRQNWQNEVDATEQYRVLARLESQPKLAQLYTNLGKVEEAHADFWEKQLRDAGAKLKPRRPSWRSRLTMWMARRFGPQFVLPVIARNEAADRNIYVPQPETASTSFTADERSHARILAQLLHTQPKGVEGSSLARLEGRHRSVGGNALRAAVLGANDGLSSNLSLVMGVAGAAVSGHVLLVTGFAGLLAGAFSMALGEWLSVTSSRELAEREIQVESSELESDPASEGEELRLIYEAKGFSAEEAKQLSNQLLTDKSAALDALSREELGIDPKELTGSPIEAALASFFLFATGAFIPVIPFIFTTGAPAIVASILLSSAALYGTGAIITVFTGRSALVSGTRQLVLGLAAATITYTIGHLIGVSLG